MASLLGSRGIDSRQMKLTYKGKGQQLFLRETEKMTSFPSVLALIKDIYIYMRPTKGEDVAACLAHIISTLSVENSPMAQSVSAEEPATVSTHLHQSVTATTGTSASVTAVLGELLLLYVKGLKDLSSFLAAAG